MRLDRASNAGDQPAATDRGDDRLHVRQVFKDLEPHGGMAGDEVVIVEGVMKVPSIPSNACVSAAFQASS